MNKNNFISYREKENNNSEPKFVPNKMTALRKKKKESASKSIRTRFE